MPCWTKDKLVSSFSVSLSSGTKRERLELHDLITWSTFGKHEMTTGSLSGLTLNARKEWSLRIQPSLLLAAWDVSQDSTTEMPYWWRKSFPESGQELWWSSVWHFCVLLTLRHRRLSREISHAGRNAERRLNSQYARFFTLKNWTTYGYYFKGIS